MAEYPEMIHREPLSYAVALKHLETYGIQLLECVGPHQNLIWSRQNSYFE